MSNKKVLCSSIRHNAADEVYVEWQDHWLITAPVHFEVTDDIKS